MASAIVRITSPTEVGTMLRLTTTNPLSLSTTTPAPRFRMLENPSRAKGMVKWTLTRHRIRSLAATYSVIQPDELLGRWHNGSWQKRLSQIGKVPQPSLVVAHREPKVAPMPFDAYNVDQRGVNILIE